MGVELLPGYRFQPTDEELIHCYLRNKVSGEPLSCYGAIQDCHLYGVGNKEPWNLFGTTSGDNLYVYTKLIKKNSKAKRVERTAGCGTWKLQRSEDVKVKVKGKDVVIGFKKLLVFEVKGKGKGKGKGGGSKSSNNNINDAANVNGHWIMHELSLADDDSGYVVCDIRNKNAKVKEDRNDYNYYSYYADHDDDIHGIDKGQGEVENPTLLLTDHQHGDNKNMQDCQAIDQYSSQISNMMQQQQQQYIHVNVQDQQANEYSTQSQSYSTHTNDQAQKGRKRDEQEDDQDQLLHQQKRFKPLIGTTDAFPAHQQNPVATLSIGEVEETGNNVFGEQVQLNANAGQGWAAEDQSAGGSTGNLGFEDSQFNAADHSMDILINPQDLGPIFFEDIEFGVDGNNLMLEDIDFGVGADVDELDNVMIQGGTTLEQTLDDIRKFMEGVDD